MTDPLKAARWQIGNLTYPDLLTLRDDIAKILAAYESGGALTGRGSLELKVIKRSVITKRVDEEGKEVLEPKIIDCGPYAYVRRWMIDEKGKISLTSSGYYGVAGAEAVIAGLGDQLLEAHLNGGEPAGDNFLVEHGFEPPYRRSLHNKPLTAPPIHPLGDESITAENITSSPIFAHYRANAPTNAAQLLQDLRQYETDLASYRDAEQNHLMFRLNNETLVQRRKRASRRQFGQPPRRVRRV